MKCKICLVCSWVVGLSTIALGLTGIFRWTLPNSSLAGAGFTVLVLIALGFLYYQIVPCPRCVARTRGFFAKTEKADETQETESV